MIPLPRAQTQRDLSHVRIKTTINEIREINGKLQPCYERMSTQLQQALQVFKKAEPTQPTTWHDEKKKLTELEENILQAKNWNRSLHDLKIRIQAVKLDNPVDAGAMTIAKQLEVTVNNMLPSAEKGVEMWKVRIRGARFRLEEKQFREFISLWNSIKTDMKKTPERFIGQVNSRRARLESLRQWGDENRNEATPEVHSIQNMISELDDIDLQIKQMMLGQRRNIERR